MEYAEDIRLHVNGPYSAPYYIAHSDEDGSLKALELRKELTERQTEARLVRDVIYFDGYLEFATSKILLFQD